MQSRRRRREGRPSYSAAPHRASFDTLEARQLLAASVKTVKAAPTMTNPLVLTLKAASSAMKKKVALAADFTALTAFTKPAAADVGTTVGLTQYVPFSAQLTSLQKSLAAAPALGSSKTGLTIALPAPDGTLQRFSIFQSSVMEAGLAVQTASSIRTFTGIGIDDPTQNIAMDYTSSGLHASILGSAGSWYIDPYWTRDNAQYASYFKSDAVSVGGFVCDTDDLDEDVAAVATTSKTAFSSAVNPSLVSGTQLRTYRLAMATTGEYTAYQGGAAAALNAVISVVTRLNQVYERDLGIHLNLIANESSIIFPTAASDPFTSANNPDTSIAQLQTRLDSAIGTTNYDIGHMLHRVTSATQNNGLAGDIGSVGTAATKGQGYSAYNAPTTDPFTIDYVAHEIGHQFGGHHNFSSVGGQAYDDVPYVTEPGSGTTIMSYTGIGNTNENIQAHSDAMFSSINFEQINAYITSGTHGAVISNTGNSQPSVTALNNVLSYTIPASTPFALTAVGADADASDVLTYSWEQRDADEGTLATPTSTKTAGPSFRNYLPSASATRTFPILSTVLNGGTTNVGETLPSVARAMHFQVMIRDNHTGGGSAATLASQVTVNTTVTGAAFRVLNLDTTSTLTGGANQLISWNVAGTTAAAFNAANVNILLSTDGGLTFPITLAAATANDGSQTVQLPYGIGSTTARIKIQPVNNIFFDINNANLTLTNVAVPASGTPGTPTLLAASDTGISNSDNITKLNNAAVASVLSFSVGQTVAGALVELLADGAVIGSVTATGTAMTISTNEGATLADGSHVFTVRQTEAGKPVSTASAPRNVTIDTVSPTLAAAPGGHFSYETGQKFVYTFSTDVAASTIVPSDVSVKSADGPTFAPSAVAFDAGTGVATFTLAALLPDGNYVVTLNPDLVTDAAGNAVATDVSSTFVLAGDANRDRTVNFDDLIVLAQNYNATGKTFSQGNFDYSPDGTVNFDDLILLAQRYNVTLAPPAALVAAAGFSGGTEKDDDRTPAQDVLA